MLLYLTISYCILLPPLLLPLLLLLQVASVYAVPVGDIEQLHKSAMLLSGKMVEFSAEIGWTSLAQILRTFTPLLKDVGIGEGGEGSERLRDVLCIPGMNVKTAKILIAGGGGTGTGTGGGGGGGGGGAYGAGALDSCAGIAGSDPRDIAQCLRLSLAFDVRR
jgi:uncharacterized membrane protein YgcG